MARKVDWKRVLGCIPQSRRAAVKRHVMDDRLRMAAVAPGHPLVTTGAGFKRHLRFKPDQTALVVSKACGTKMHEALHKGVQGGLISMAALKQFYRDMGYSLDGFVELFEESL